MTMQRLLKRIHIMGTAWFMVCAAALLVISLRQAGVNWWLIFSISGYSMVLFIFLLVFYLFALFRGVVRAQCAEEHPLSTSPAYLFFYDSAPFLGAIAGWVSSFGISDVMAVARMVTEGTLGMTFVTWVVIDSAVGMVEASLPGSIHHRSRRLAETRAEKRRIQKENEEMLQSLELKERQMHQHWEQTFRESAVELAQLYSSPNADLGRIQELTAETGAKAWRVGRISCMRFVHQMILDEMTCKPGGYDVDYAALWWDGIGTWRRPKGLTASLIQA